MFKYITLFAAFISLNTLAAGVITDGVVQGGNALIGTKNFVKNPFCQKNVLNFTSPLEMAATPVARDTDAADKLNAVSSCAITTSANDNPHALYFDIRALDNDVVGNCEATAMFKGNGATDGWSFGVDDGAGATLTSVALTDEAGWKKVSVNYPCGASIRPVFLSTGESKTLNVGNVYLGAATNVGSVSQSQFIGKYKGSTTSIGSGATDIVFPTAESASDSNMNTSTGIYTVKKTGVYTFNLYLSSADTTGTGQFIAYANRTGSVSEQVIIGINNKISNANVSKNIKASVSYSLAINDTIKFQAQDADTFALDARSYVEISYTPGNSEQAVRVDQTAQSWSGFHKGLNCNWNTTTTSFVNPDSGDADCDLTERTNSNFGVVTSTADGTGELPGLTFIPKSVGKLYICAVAQAANSSVSGTTTLRLTDGTNVIAINSLQASVADVSSPVPLCGELVVSSTASKTVKVELAANGNTAFIKSGGTLTSNIEWSIVNISQSLPAPLLVGSEINVSSGFKKNLEATLNCDSGSAITSQDGTTSIGVASIGNISSGVCALTFAGMGSSTPRCKVNTLGTTKDAYARINPTSATAADLYCTKPSDGTDLTACDVNIECKWLN